MVKRKEESGITLIALIITIIVLLILAGVSISLVVGENGIISRATDSREKTNKAEAEERVALEVSGSYDETGTINLDDLNKNLRENLSGVKLNGKALSDSNKIEKLPAIVQYKGYDIKIGEKGEVTIEESTSGGGTTPTDPDKEQGDEPTTSIPLPSEGDIVNIGKVTVNGEELVNGWQCLLKENDTVYIIYEDYLEENAIPIIGDTITKSNYNVYSTGGRDDLLNYLKGEGLYTTVWDEIKTGVENALKKQGITTAITVTGAPTVELFYEAYNKKYPEDKFKIKHFNSAGEDSNGGDNVVAEGYFYSLGEPAIYRYKADVKESRIYSDEMFFPNPGEGAWNGCYGYWLARSFGCFY